MYYYGARYYAPWMGRWISSDDIYRTDDINLFRFVKNTPTRRVEENGHQSKESDSANTNSSSSWSDPEYWKATIKSGVILGTRQALATINPLDNGLGVLEDQKRTNALIEKGEYEKAVIVSTGKEEYFELAKRAETKKEAAALIVGEKIGTNHLVEGITGDDRDGNVLTDGQRTKKVVVGGLKLLETAAQLLTGTKFSTGKISFKLGKGKSTPALPTSKTLSFSDINEELLAYRKRVIKHDTPDDQIEQVAKNIGDGTFSKTVSQLSAGQRNTLALTHRTQSQNLRNKLIKNKAKRDPEKILREAGKITSTGKKTRGAVMPDVVKE